ncbi:MAG TPA: HEAT repeat domain-containing protein [Gemmatimonadaceae bacterium]|nr:HEAT repeat domain-containing protein [Gemmatimonadaceae bacterium]
MDYSLTFARHFARLVWLLARSPDSIEEQKAALRALVTISKSGLVTLAISPEGMVANGMPVPEALDGVPELDYQFRGHAIRAMAIDMGAFAADILGTARIFAAVTPQGDEGRALDAQLRALSARTVRVTYNRAERVSDAIHRVSEAIPAVRMPTPGPVPVIRTPTPGAMPRYTPPAPVQAVPAAVDGLESASVSVRASAFTTDVHSDVVREFTAVDRPRENADEFFDKLDTTSSISATSRLLDQVVAAIEQYGRDSKTVAVADLFYKIVSREQEKTDPDLRRAYAAAIRRLSKPTVLRGVASVLPKRKERASDYLAVLARAGEEGAEALIEQLTAAQSLTERRVYFSALVTLKAGASTLTHMLGDARWYVARNAADLLGELNAVEAEGPLAELLKHDDERVRRAATNALAKLGTAHANLALKRALRDSSPQVRATAAAGLASSRPAARGTRTAATLLRALDGESDVEVQIAILSALGRIGTADAVERLIKAAEPDGRLFKRKPASFRVAAVQALGEARTPTALAALQVLTTDRDKDVRDAAQKAVADVAPGDRLEPA